jgi:transcriptional regulator with XRE-family HTH domain
MGRPLLPVDETKYSGRFAARMRKLREKTGMTGEQLAEAITNAGFYCQARTYYGWESAKRIPSIDSLPAIAEALGVTIRSLFPQK